jgi:hypothetical protein
LRLADSHAKGKIIQRCFDRSSTDVFTALSTLGFVDMFSAKAISNQIGSEGYATQEGVLSEHEVEELIHAIEQRQDGEGLQRRGRIFAVRNLLDLAEIRRLADSTPVRDLVRAILGDEAFPVRGILFDKIPEANWKVPWHQDVTIAVQERRDIEGYGPWSTKAGILHVQPPASVLEKMVSIRLHLDACDELNGALHVIPKSHRSGRIDESEIPFILAQSQVQVCCVGCGGALLMRPLLLHASSASQTPAHRRVIHLDFACEQLPSPLRWLSERGSVPESAGELAGNAELSVN